MLCLFVVLLINQSSLIVFLVFAVPDEQWRLLDLLQVHQHSGLAHLRYDQLPSLSFGLQRALCVFSVGSANVMPQLSPVCTIFAGPCFTGFVSLGNNTCADINEV